MIGTLSLAQLAHRFGGTLLFPDAHFGAVSTDSRTLMPGELFVALRGDRFDGHQFLAAVADRACGLVVAKPDRTLRIPQWIVGDTQLALGQIALTNRERFHGPLIAITGSSGKTTVKEMVAAILARTGEVLATEGNLNNHIGVPLTLLNIGEDHCFAVIEMGASGPGEISSYCQWAKPGVALVNNVAPAHLAGFGTLEGVARAKGEIYQSLATDGLAVINLDDPFSTFWSERLQGRSRLTYGIGIGAADVSAGDIRLEEGGCCRFSLHIQGGASVPVLLPIPGQHNVANALAAAAIAHAVGVGAEDIALGLANVSSVGGRMGVCRGFRGARLIDDTYNANPASVMAAIDTLATFPGRRVLVLGDMGELGETAAQLHHEVGQYAQRRAVDELWTVGLLSEEAARGFGSAATHCQSREALIDALKSALSADTTVLVKGSRSTGMEAVVAALKEEVS